MKKIILRNGLTLINKPSIGESVTIEVTAKVGSNYEADKIAGISHFVEHMVFAGTKKRPSARAIASEIDKIGGEFNAFTSNERTSFYVIVPKKYFDIGLDVLADMLQNPTFKNKIFNKEKKVILDEFSLLEDNPRSYQSYLFNKALFRESTAGRPIIGYRKSVKNLKRKDLVEYYKKYYTKNNLIIVISGNIKNIKTKVEKAFSKLTKRELIEKPIIKEEKYIKVRKIVEKKEVMHSYLIIGYRVCNRKHHDSYVLDVIRAILGGGMSSRLFEEIRVKHGLAYNVEAEYEANRDYGSFYTYLSTDKKHLDKAKRLLLEAYKLKDLTEKEIKKAKTHIEGRFILDIEDIHKQADIISDWELKVDAKLVKDYIKNINKVTKEDIERVAKRYFTKNYTTALIKQK